MGIHNNEEDFKKKIQHGFIFVSLRCIAFDSWDWQMAVGCILWGTKNLIYGLHLEGVSMIGKSGYIWIKKQYITYFVINYLVFGIDA